MNRIIIKKDPEALARAGADIFCSVAAAAIAQKGAFTAALSGGSTPRPMYRLLASDRFRSAIDWRQTHIFWVDERLVPPDHPASNFGLARQDLLIHVPLPATNIHPMPTEGAPDRNAFQYQRLLGDFFARFPGGLPVFDLIILGVGSDGHVASLFPGQSPPGDAVWVLAVRGGKPNLARLTLTFQVLNSGSRIILLVSGKEKAAIVKTVLEKPFAGLPAQNIRPHGSSPTWLLDRAAASRLSERTLNEAAEDGVGP